MVCKITVHTVKYAVCQSTLKNVCVVNQVQVVAEPGPTGGVIPFQCCRLSKTASAIGAAIVRIEAKAAGAMNNAGAMKGRRRDDGGPSDGRL